MTDNAQAAALSVFDTKLDLSFTKFEIKTIRFANGRLAECSIIEDLI